MYSNYSCSPEDDFFQSLEQSLTNEYSAHMMSNFISDLIVALNSLDDDAEEGLIFNDDECFTLPSSQANAYEERLIVAPNNLDDDAEEGFIFNENDNDHLNSYECFTLPSSQVNVYDKRHQISIHANEATTAREKEDDNISVDMFAEFQNDIEEMDGASDCADKVVIREQSQVVELQNDLVIEANVSDRAEKLNIYEQQAVEKYRNDEEMMKEDTNQICGKQNVEVTQNINKFCAISKGEECIHLNESPSVNISTQPKLVQQQTELEGIDTHDNLRFEKLSQKLNRMVCVPSNISYSTNDKPYENDRALSIELKTSQIEHQTIQRAHSKSSSFHGLSLIKAKSSHIRSVSESVGFRRFFLPADETSNATVKKPSSRFPNFRGFSTAALTRSRDSYYKPISCSSGSGSDVNTTLCEDYETANNFVPEMERSSSQETNLRGFSPTALIRPRALLQKPIGFSSLNGRVLNTSLCVEYETANNFLPEMKRSSSQESNFRGYSAAALIRPRTQIAMSRSESDLDTTLCQEYETADNFIAEMNASRVSNFNFEEAYSQCFLENENQNGK